MSDAEDPIRKSDLPTRFVMGVVMIAVAVAAVYLGGWWFRALVAAAAALMLFEWADEGRNFPVLGRGDVRIQMCAVEDLLDCVVAVLDADPETANDTYNVAAEQFGTLREDFQSVLDAAGHGRRVVGLPARPALAALRALEATRLSPVYGRLLHKLLAPNKRSTEGARLARDRARIDSKCHGNRHTGACLFPRMPHGRRNCRRLWHRRGTAGAHDGRRRPDLAAAPRPVHGTVPMLL